jgi:hypothetical protein
MAWHSAIVRLDPHAGETTTRSDLLVEARGWLLFFKVREHPLEIDTPVVINALYRNHGCPPLT